MSKLCSVPECDLPHKGLGYCNTHLARWYRRGTVNLPERTYAKDLPCSVEDCSRNQHAKGMCRVHYRRPKVDGETRTCIVEGCDKPFSYRDRCKNHAEELRRRSKGIMPRVPAGPYLSNSNGYVYLLVKGKQKLVHRLIMEEILGRNLHPHETVHHVNGIKTDNRPENLELWSSSHPAGQRVVDKIAWAKEILALYEPDFPGSTQPWRDQ